MNKLVPWWKRALSYLMEVHIESTTSPYNPHLYVSMKKGQFMLSTDKAIYSYGVRYENFGEAFKSLDLSNMKTCLVLGFGLGSIPMILEKKLSKDISYTGVEIDEEVIYLASKYVLPELHSSIDIVNADVMAFITRCEDSYDMICMDVFESDYIPPEMESEEFLKSLDNMLNEGGLLLFNRLYYKEEDIVRTHFYFDNVFKSVFPDATTMNIQGNWILIYQKDTV